jgi:hypothetical protein
MRTRATFAVGRWGKYTQQWIIYASIALAVGLTNGCASLFEPIPQLSVSLACKDAWARVADGRGAVLVERLDVNDPARPIHTTNRAGQDMELVADVFSKFDNRRLGAATTTVWVPTRTTYWSDGQGNSGTSTRADRNAQLRTWEINYLTSSVEPSYSCWGGLRD